MVTTAVATRRAMGYLRVSTHNQAGERHVSLETQEARVRAYAEAHGFRYVGSFTDVLSGRRDDRREYRRMVDAALGGDADVILVQYLDRFGRRPQEILRRIWELQDHNVKVEATDEDIREELVLLVRAGLAGAESRRNSERVRATMNAAVAKGKHVGPAPFGYRRASDSKWEQNPSEAATVREMYRLAVAENIGYKGMADRLSQAGIPTRRGTPWTSTAIWQILTNPALAGVLVYGRRTRKGNPAGQLVRIEGFFPAILNPDEWQALQQRLAIRRESRRGHTHKSDYLLSGTLRCGHCGGAMIGSRRVVKGRVYKNYGCGNNMRSKATCEFWNGHSARKLEPAILEYLAAYSDPERVRELLKAQGSRALSTWKDQLKVAEKRLAELDQDFHKNLDLLKANILTEEEFNRANLVRRQERATVQARIAELSTKLQQEQGKSATAEALPAKVRSFLEAFESLEVRKAKALLQTILKAAHVYRDGRIELEFRA